MELSVSLRRLLFALWGLTTSQAIGRRSSNEAIRPNVVLLTGSRVDSVPMPFLLDVGFWHVGWANALTPIMRKMLARRPGARDRLGSLRQCTGRVV